MPKRDEESADGGATDNDDGEGDERPGREVVLIHDPDWLAAGNCPNARLGFAAWFGRERPAVVSLIVGGWRCQSVFRFRFSSVHFRILSSLFDSTSILFDSDSRRFRSFLLQVHSFPF